MSQLVGHISQVIGPVVDVLLKEKTWMPNCVSHASMMLWRLSVPMVVSWWLKYNNTSEKTRCVLSQWTVPTACEEVWRLSPQDSLLQCRWVSR